MSDPMSKVMPDGHSQAPRSDVLPDGKEMGRYTAADEDSGYSGPNWIDHTDAPACYKERMEKKP